MNNRKRLKKLILANKETRCLYRMMQFLAIFMIVSCLVIIATAKWIEYDQNEKREEIFGSWDEVFLNVDQEDLNYFRKNAFLEQISVQSIQEKVFLEGDQRVVIGACDDNFLEMGNIDILEGRMPEHEREVAIEEEYLEILGVSKVGDIVPEYSSVESLRGYILTGVVSNYSTRWKTINYDVKYINCFIHQGDFDENLVFSIYSMWAKRDPEINRIDYRLNINNFEIDIHTALSKNIGSIIVVEFIVVVNIYFSLKRRRYDNYKEQKRGKLKKAHYVSVSLIIIIAETILTLSLFKSITGIVVKSVCINNILIEEKQIQIINTLEEDPTFRFNANENGKNVFYVIDNLSNLENILDKIVNVFLFFVMLKFIISIDFFKCKMMIKEKENYYFLNEYYKYRGFSYMANKELIKTSITLVVIEIIILIYLFVSAEYNINFLKTGVHIIIVDILIMFIFRRSKNKMLIEIESI